MKGKFRANFEKHIASYLSLNRAIGTDVKAVEDHVEVAGGGGHEEEEEVEVGEGEQPVLVDCIQKVASMHLGFAYNLYSSDLNCYLIYRQLSFLSDKV